MACPLVTAFHVQDSSSALGFTHGSSCWKMVMFAWGGRAFKPDEIRVVSIIQDKSDHLVIWRSCRTCKLHVSLPPATDLMRGCEIGPTALRCLYGMLHANVHKRGQGGANLGPREDDIYSGGDGEITGV